jgi:hypothetical protein
MLCRVFGHRFRLDGTCGCGAALPSTGDVRIRHVLSCFFAGHVYTKIGTREGHNEYACGNCGHPLLIATDVDSFPADRTFRKPVNYWCGWFGHHVHRVRTTAAGTEYACRCGHSFVARPPTESHIVHPWHCFLGGHRITLLDARDGYRECFCLDCGHPFLYLEARVAEGREDCKTATTT